MQAHAPMTYVGRVKVIPGDGQNKAFCPMKMGYPNPRQRGMMLMEEGRENMSYHDNGCGRVEIE